MNKMYAYLKEHAYVSENKHSNYQFELSEERAKCIANKYNSLTEELQQENKQLKDNWNSLKKQEINRFNNTQDVQFLDVLQDMLEIEKGVNN